jgi:hypothetical protein
LTSQDNHERLRALLLNPMECAFSTAERTLQGYEAMHRLRKGQIEGFAKGDVLTQNRVINQMFGLAA